MGAPTIRPGAEGKAAGIRLFLVDVDGVLTDGGIVYDANGLELKRFNVRDGHGFVMMRRAGIRAGIITGRTSAVTAIRAKELGIDLVVQGATDKAAALDRVLADTGIPPEAVSYVGDDIVDLPVFRRVGFTAAPADAEDCVLAAADFVSSRPGGHGAVREIIEFVLRATGSWDKVASRYLGPEAG
ncbi:MAG TPA: HAD hydrolase family protein [Candidatus Deferrimicrobiaceae bacterium]